MDSTRTTIQYIKSLAIAVFSADDYRAPVIDINAKNSSFFIIADTDVTLKVETARGEIGSFTFLRGYNPVLINRIIVDGGNTVTTIQVGY